MFQLTCVLSQQLKNDAFLSTEVGKWLKEFQNLKVSIFTSPRLKCNNGQFLFSNDLTYSIQCDQSCAINCQTFQTCAQSWNYDNNIFKWQMVKTSDILSQLIIPPETFPSSSINSRPVSVTSLPATLKSMESRIHLHQIVSYIMPLLCGDFF